MNISSLLLSISAMPNSMWIWRSVNSSDLSWNILNLSLTKIVFTWILNMLRLYLNNYIFNFIEIFKSFLIFITSIVNLSITFSALLDYFMTCFMNSRMIRSLTLLLMTSNRHFSRISLSSWLMLLFLHLFYVIMIHCFPCVWRLMYWVQPVQAYFL